MKSNFPILLVDDDALLVDILHRASRDHFPEASFIQVFSNTEAIAYINALDGHGPKLVFLDIDLGSSVNGLDFLAFLQAHAQGRLLPVIMLTASQLPSTILTTYSTGAASFTVKPFSFDDWKMYFITLRQYWFDTVTIPPIRFYKRDYWT
ncbi:response regulator [Spirosoma sp. KCTC 42546]|uniref:response regulator n=1 Tax=Spirosoma sp. KCTC 42546 TaxID=2520506 RepID=UPI001158DF2B|nr:response regulator [Spirosoma sp. KCTC 42546]QDK78601.1 response regulator [Spirosoma sp. KCTC 42546]